jgi:hypothetical protein
MILKKAVNLRLVIGVVLTLMALVAFNLSRPGLHRDLHASFNHWCQGAVTRLAPGNELKDSDLALKIVVTLKDAANGSRHSIWNLPLRSILDPEERDNIARILQLIKESSVFGMSPLKDPSLAQSVLTISVKEGENVFETAVSLESVRGNIQLMNLIKLLEVYASATPEAPNVSHQEP